MHNYTCPACGSQNLHRSQGKGPHAAKLTCGDCGRFLKWLSKRELEKLGGLSIVQHDLFS